MIKVGSKVIVPWWEFDGHGNTIAVKVLEGTIESIDGAYHYVKIHNDSKYDVLELYPIEFKVIDEELS